MAYSRQYSEGSSKGRLLWEVIKEQVWNTNEKDKVYIKMNYEAKSYCVKKVYILHPLSV